MAVERMDHVGVVVDDLDAAVAFFVDLGLQQVDRAEIAGEQVDRLLGIDGVRSEAVWLRAPGGAALELTRFRSPAGTDEPRAPAFTARGLRHLAFEVDDLDATLARLHPHDPAPLGETLEYGGVYRLVFVRGPEGIVVELAERLRPSGDAAT